MYWHSRPSPPLSYPPHVSFFSFLLSPFFFSSASSFSFAFLHFLFLLLLSPSLLRSVRSAFHSVFPALRPSSAPTLRRIFLCVSSVSSPLSHRPHLLIFPIFLSLALRLSSRLIGLIFLIFLSSLVHLTFLSYLTVSLPVSLDHHPPDRDRQLRGASSAEHGQHVTIHHDYAGFFREPPSSAERLVKRRIGVTNDAANNERVSVSPKQYRTFPNDPCQDW